MEMENKTIINSTIIGCSAQYDIEFIKVLKTSQVIHKFFAAMSSQRSDGVTQLVLLFICLSVFHHEGVFLKK